jgi:hypothetical protein
MNIANRKIYYGMRGIPLMEEISSCSRRKIPSVGKKKIPPI